MRLSKKYSVVLFGVFMSVAMSFAMSLTMTLVNVGLTSNFFLIWVKAFFIGFVVAFPTSLAVMPLARKLVSKIVEE